MRNLEKRIILAAVVVFITWSILDFILHGLLLRSTYEATANLWRPMDKMNMPLMYFVTLVFTVCFVLIYGLLDRQKSLVPGIQFGVLFGLATGISMGFGSYEPIKMKGLIWNIYPLTFRKNLLSSLTIGHQKSSLK